MQRAALDGVEIAYEVRGDGEPVVLIHHGSGLDWYAPLLREPALADRYRLCTYHRVGFGESSPADGPVDFGQEARHCALLLRHLDLEPAHIVGHSSSAMIALQVALDSPDAVQTLALLESARPAVQNDRQAEFVQTVLMPALGRYRAGDSAGAIDTWLRGVCGADYRAPLERAVPGAFEQALADADAYFGQELPAVQQWSFTPEDARRVTHPALAVLGANSDPVFRERRELLLDWLPNAEPFDLADATHLLHVENPRGLAGALAAFIARHPVAPA